MSIQLKNQNRGKKIIQHHKVSSEFNVQGVGAKIKEEKNHENKNR